MHGVSDPAMFKAFELFGLPQYIPVVAQQKPDPEFPTVKFPNPEEKGTHFVLLNFEFVSLLVVRRFGTFKRGKVNAETPLI